jgi:chemotaxis protein methyltransferase CheR
MSDELVSAEVVRHFCHVANRRLGVSLPAGTEALVASRVAKRLKVLGLPLMDYVARLQEDQDCEEIVEFLDLVRPRAERFFQRRADLISLHDKVRDLLIGGLRRIRLWSAGCGSGEEAYSMAVVVFEAMRALEVEPDSVDLKILASDISPRALGRGRRGVYSLDQARWIPRHLRARYFGDDAEGVVVSAEMRTRLVFRRLNLSRPPYPMKGPLQAIFLREALALLDPPASRRVVAATKALLGEGGLLFGGDGMPEISSDEPEIHATEAWEDIPAPTSEIC